MIQRLATAYSASVGIFRFRTSVAKSDVFLLSGVEDLVRVLSVSLGGQWIPEDLPPRMVNGATYRLVASLDGLDGGSDGQDIVAFLKSLLSTYLVREPARDHLRVADFTSRRDTIDGRFLP